MPLNFHGLVNIAKICANAYNVLQAVANRNINKITIIAIIIMMIMTIMNNESNFYSAKPNKKLIYL